MRIISGKYRGRTLYSSNDKSIRPTIDRVKESVCNILQFDISGSVVLDLFAGAGSYGVECISRAAAQVVFNDVDTSSVELIKKNTRAMTENFTILNKDYILALKYLKDSKIQFDLIFLDPPFSKGLITEALKLIDKYKLLKPNGTIICEHEKKLEINIDELSLKVLRQKQYGLSAITFIVGQDGE